MRLAFHRKVWEFDELAERWGIKDERLRNLRRAVKDRELSPFRTVHCAMQPLTLDGPEGQLTPLGEPRECRGRLWIAHEFGIETGDLDALYPVLRDRPEPDAETQYWAAANPICMDDVFASFVVSDEDRSQFERAHSAKEFTLDARQEASRDVMLVTMYHELYGWSPGDEQVKGVTKLSFAAKGLGFTLSVPTIREHLQRALTRARIAEDEQAHLSVQVASSS